MYDSHQFVRYARHPERWERKAGELVALFAITAGKHTFLAPYTLPELKRISQSLEKDSAKEGIYPHEAQAAIDCLASSGDTGCARSPCLAD